MITIRDQEHKHFNPEKFSHPVMITRKDQEHNISIQEHFPPCSDNQKKIKSMAIQRSFPTLFLTRTSTTAAAAARETVIRIPTAAPRKVASFQSSTWLGVNADLWPGIVFVHEILLTCCDFGWLHLQRSLQWSWIVDRGGVGRQQREKASCEELVVRVGC